TSTMKIMTHSTKTYVFHHASRSRLSVAVLWSSMIAVARSAVLLTGSSHSLSMLVGTRSVIGIVPSRVVSPLKAIAFLITRNAKTRMYYAIHSRAHAEQRLDRHARTRDRVSRNAIDLILGQHE